MYADDAIEHRIEHLLSQMTLKEKIDYIGGHNSFYIRAIPRLKIPEIRIADGPVGVRNYGPSTTYPAGINIASSWNKSLALLIGQAMGSDARARGVHILLAPGVNICRSPLCGRNFEYLGEDPHLTSSIAVQLIEGLQSQNVAACIKHFVANNQEWNRHQVSSDVDMRTLREIYLPAFEAAVKEAKVANVMASYNLVNGTHMTQNGKFNLDLLKKEWGFTGCLMSDWTSVYDGIEAAVNGLDLEMPYAAFMNRETLFLAIQNGKVQVATIDDKVRRILRVLATFGFIDTPQTHYRDSLFNHKGHMAARKMAEESIVLLKNEEILPLNQEKIRSIAVIGPCAAKIVPHGSGSSETVSHLSQSYIGAISDLCGDAIDLQYASGVPDLNCPECTTTLDGQEKGFVGEYYDNTTLSGPPALTRVDSTLAFSFKERSYKKGGPVNHFSARWTGFMNCDTPGDYTFYLAGNDGYRLFVNDILIIDRWNKAPSSLEHKTISLHEPKKYKITVEYYVEHGPQAIKLGVCPGENTAIERAQEVAASAEIAIVCAGFDVEHEGEDWDRTFHLPLNQSALIQAVASVNPRTIVVMSAGGNVDMQDWLEQTKALVYAWYPGQEGAKALADILFGKVSPSGKLPVSFEKNLQDNATFTSYYDKDNNKRVPYSEGIFVGYRHFDKNAITPQFPFGFGLSYSTFGYSNLKINGQMITFDITNTGKCTAKEVAQVYVANTNATIPHPVKELKGFEKVELAPNQTKTVTITLNDRAFSYYNTDTNSWTQYPGTFEILVGSSSRHIHLKGPCNPHP